MFPVAEGGRKLTNDVGRSPESFGMKNGVVDVASQLLTQKATQSPENFGTALRSNLLLRENPTTNEVGKIPESLEPDNMVPEHYIIKKKSPKNNVVNFVHKKKSIFFSNTSPHSIDAITGVILGTKKTSQNEIILKSSKTSQNEIILKSSKTSQTPRLETQKSMYDIRMNNASNFVLYLE